jgi:porin
MTRGNPFTLVAAVLALAGTALGQGAAIPTEPAAQPASAPASQPASAPSECECSWYAHDTMTGGWFGLGKSLADQGITVNLSLTQIYQENLRGGLSTHRQAGRYEGSYDLELNADLEKLVGLKGGRVYAHGEGSWSDGLSPSSIGGLFNVNNDAMGNHAIELTELYYEQKVFEDRVTFRLGKLDLRGGLQCHGCPVSFDGSSFANDQKSQFLNAALCNNPTIPFPNRGLGAIVHAEPVNGWYVSAGAADAEAQDGETGFNTAFHGPADFFSIYETGFLPQIPSPHGPLQGAYRGGFWYEEREKEEFEDASLRRDDHGFYVSADQMVLKESNSPGDSRGLGLFARWGLADGRVNPVRQFWSVGGQYKGLAPSRDDDVLGLGVGQGLLSRDAGFTRPQETVIEVYYNAAVTPWLHVSPSLQYLFDPGGDSQIGNAVVLGARVQIAF